MKKQGLANLILRCASVVLAVLSFVWFALKFVFQKMGNIQVNMSFKDWNDLIKLGKSSKANYIATWSAARVFLIITLVLVVIVAILAVVQMFWNNKYLTLALWIVAGATVLCALLFVILLGVGGSQAVKGLKDVTVGPHAGAILLTVSPIAAAVCAFVPTMLKRKA